MTVGRGKHDGGKHETVDLNASLEWFLDCPLCDQTIGSFHLPRLVMTSNLMKHVLPNVLGVFMAHNIQFHWDEMTEDRHGGV